MKRIYSFILILSSLAAISCKDFLDINETPNNLKDTSIPNILPGAQIGIAFTLGNTIQNATSLWMQHVAGTGTQTDPFDRYNVTTSDFQTEWNTVYSTLQDDLNQIAAKGNTEGNFIHTGMAEVLSAYVWAMSTDMWGDMPYSQAFKIVQFPKPQYDSQQDIYTQILALVDQGKADLQKTNVLTTSSGDLIYGGVADKWIRAANSLKLKLLIQMRLKDAALATTEINNLIAENKFISSNAENFILNFSTTSGSQNPIYQYGHQTRANDLVISSRFYDSLNTLSDPRIPYLFTKFGSSYVTYNNGLNQTSAFTGAGAPVNAANRSRWGAYIVGNGTATSSGTITGAGSAPIRMITKSMVNFWLAEAQLTLGTSGNASAYFKQAIQDHMDDIKAYTSAPASFDALATTYINARVAAFNAATSVTGPGGKLNILIRDKWVTSAGNAYEAFNDFRRTGFPRLTLAQNAQPGVTKIPSRLPYALSEIQSNVENVPLQSYPAGLLVPVWWMAQ